MLTKIIVVLFLFAIIGSLGSGLYLSVLLFILLMLAYATGVLQPHGVYPG
jgi:hypothetical protein